MLTKNKTKHKNQSLGSDLTRLLYDGQQPIVNGELIVLLMLPSPASQ